MSEKPYYGVAQVCTNGHVITIDYDDKDYERMKKCSICGADTITECPACGHPIRGGLCVDTITDYLDVCDRYQTEIEHRCFSTRDDYSLPNFCAECGHPFPWMEQKVARIKNELLRNGIEEQQINYLMELLPDLITDNPKTQYAVTQFKKIVDHLKENAAGCVKEVFIEVLAEGAKRMMFP